MENKFLDFASDLYDVLAMNTELCTQEAFFNQYVKEDKSFMLNLGRDKSYIYFDNFKITIEKR